MKMNKLFHTVQIVRRVEVETIVSVGQQANHIIIERLTPGMVVMTVLKNHMLNQDHPQ